MGRGQDTAERILSYEHCDEHRKRELRVENGADRLIAGFGDHNGCVGLISSTGRLYTWAKHASQSMTDTDNYAFCYLPHCSSLVSGDVHDTGSSYGDDGNASDALRYIAAAVRGNGQIALIIFDPTGRQLMIQFPSIGHRWASTPRAAPVAGSLLAWHIDAHNPANRSTSVGQLKQPLVQLAANEIGFIALCASAEQSFIYTWGDGRYQIFGREVSAQTPAGDPCLVTDLQGPFRIKQIAAAGWLMAAVSDQGEAWVWGLGCTPGSDSLGKSKDSSWLDAVSEPEEGSSGIRKICKSTYGEIQDIPDHQCYDY